MSKNTRKNIHRPYIKAISLTFPYQTPLGKWTDWLRLSQESTDLGYQKTKTHIFQTPSHSRLLSHTGGKFFLYGATTFS